jgi:hypothetical protein
MTLLQEFALRFGLKVQGERIYGFHGFISEHDGRLWIWTHSHSPNGHRFAPLRTQIEEQAALSELAIEINVAIALSPRPKTKLIHFSCGHSESRDDIREDQLKEREDGTYDYPFLCLECFGQTPEWKRFKAMLDRIAAKAAAGG